MGSSLARAWLSLPQWCAAMAATMGGLVLCGWVADVEPLKRVLPGLVAMNPATAVLFVLASASLWLQSDGSGADGSRDAGTRRHLARLLAGLVIVVAALKLGDLLLGWSTGIDQWLFADRLAGAEGSLPNRMAPNTALDFLLLGLALALLDLTTARGRRPSELLAALAAVIALLALLGYAYRVDSMSSVFRYIPMALHTAALFLLLAFGVLGARAQLGWMAVFTGSSLGGTMARRLLPALVLSMVALGWLRLEGQRRQLYGPEFGVTVYTLAFIVVITAFVAWSAASLYRIEAERRQVEAERERFFAATPDMLCTVGFDGSLRSLNPAWEQLLGYPREQLLARALIDLVHPDDQAGTRAKLLELANDGAVSFENRCRRQDGDDRWFSWSAVAADGERLIYATARDITQRRHAEQQLRQSEARIRTIIDTASDAFVAIDAAGIVSGWNRQAEAMFGWPRSEAVGQRLSEMILPEQYRARHEQGLRHFAATGEGPVVGKRIEITALRRDGEEFPVELAIWAVHGEGGYTFNAFVRDITERVRAERAILALNVELNAKAAQLEQTNRELEAFSYSISHDLRAPLRHIDGYARMLHEDAGEQLDGDLRRYLDAISVAARQMGALIDDLLAFSRLGRKPVQRTEVDMGALVEHVVRELGAGDDRRVSVEPLPPALADPALIRQVWVNLLSNALKYSLPRGAAAHIQVSGERTDGIVRYRIRDNGVGFDMRYADKLFGVFQRLHSHEEFEGTGVGLAIVQRIVSRHGGTVGAEGAPGRGATFTFELPSGADAVPAVPAEEVTG